MGVSGAPENVLWVPSAVGVPSHDGFRGLDAGARRMDSAHVVAGLALVVGL
jgi:hypothetical protein